MTRTFVAKGIEITQRDLQQILLRGKNGGSCADTINKEVALLPPADNLRMINNDEFIFAKQSFDQWSLVCLKPKPEKEIFRLVSAFNVNSEILASDYSNTTFFEITGENKNYYLSKLTHFDLRPKKFPVSTMVQTLIARIECCLYNLEDKYLLSCHSSFEDHFKERLQDAIDL